MAKICDLCGNTIGWGDVYFRKLKDDGESANLCSDCAFQFDGLLTKNNREKTETSLKWAKSIQNSGKCNPDVYNALCQKIQVAEKTLEIIHNGNNNTDTTINKNNQNYIPETSGQNRYSNIAIESSSMWTGILKIIAVIAVIGLTIAGAVIGGAIADGGGAFLGFLLGLLIGMLSISTLMVFVNMAEDTKATREYVRQIRNILDKKSQ